MYDKVVIFSEEQRSTTPFYLLQYSCTFSQNSLQGYGCTLLIDVKQRNQHDHEFLFTQLAHNTTPCIVH